VSTPNRYEPESNTGATPVPLPCCPHCGEEIPGCALYNWVAPGPSQIFCIYCPNMACRKVLHMQIVMVQADPPSRLAH